MNKLCGFGTQKVANSREEVRVWPILRVTIQKDPEFGKTGKGMGIASEMLGTRTTMEAFDSEGLEIDTITQSHFECRTDTDCMCSQ